MVDRSKKYVVSARKYRPSDFPSVVGQGMVTSTLKNAICRDQLAHAYLFCGPRGVGKTTCARIFAKTINCSNLTPDGEACNACVSCQAFNSSHSYNVYELDAASNNSVDDIRQITDMVLIPPQMGRYMVYIIDEVHMLSAAAFNAFLKTLEEPPPHAIFILATTEKHKILPTILSRCQIFDFNRIQVNDTIDYLEYIARKEGVEAEREALNLIALRADGAMRDALTIFDQVVSFSNGHVTVEAVLGGLNLLDFNVYFRLTDAMASHDYVDALMAFDEVITKGFDIPQFISGFNSHLRNLLVARQPESAKLLAIGDSFSARYIEKSRLLPVRDIVQALQLVTEAEATLRSSPNQRLHVEVLLLALIASEGDEKKNG